MNAADKMTYDVAVQKASTSLTLLEARDLKKALRWYKLWFLRQYYSNWGLCVNTGMYGTICEVSKHYPYRSGDPLYPVPGGWIAYREAKNLYTGEYGKERKRLAKFLIDVCKYKLKSTPRH